jgi:hypothetical protein
MLVALANYIIGSLIDCCELAPLVSFSWILHSAICYLDSLNLMSSISGLVKDDSQKIEIKQKVKKKGEQEGKKLKYKKGE